jgi:NADH-quinone oxidoreductase subunit H
MYGFYQILQNSLENVINNKYITLIVGYLIPTIVLILFLAFMGGFLSYLERRISGKIQSRIGPNRVGPQGLFQFIADAIKLILKEDLIPKDSDKLLFKQGPYLCVLSSFLVAVCIPFSSKIVILDFNVALFYILAVSSMATLGIIMSGWSSNNKWSLLGGMRSAAQIVSYEIPVGLSLVTIVFITGQLSLNEIIKSQTASPLGWNLFHDPGTFIAFFVYFISSLAEINRTPFDIPEAESELVSGYNTEYSGLRFAFFFLAEFANIFIMSAIACALFLGGWRLPAFMANLPGHEILMLVTFFAKTFVLIFVVIWLRWTLPRLRVDQLMSLCWKYMVPIAFFAIFITGIFTVLLGGKSLIGYFIN